MSDEIAADAAVPATPVVAEPEAIEPEPAAPVEPDTLASKAEAEAAHVVELAHRAVEELEVAADKAVGSLESHSVGLLHSDTEYHLAPQLADEGPRIEQIHTNLKAG